MLKNIKKILIIFSIIFFLLFGFIYIIGGGFGIKGNKELLDYNKSLIFAHRGVTTDCIENSLESFELADKTGFEAIEIDINLSKDKHLVIFHDFSCKRLLGIDTIINQMYFQDIINSNLLYKGIPSKNKVVSLKSILKLYKNSKLFYLDIKDVNKTVADSLIKYINTFNIHKKVLIADSNLFFLAYIKFFDPEISTVLETYSKNKELLLKFIPKKFKPDYCAWSVHKIDDNYIRFLKENGYSENLIVYGVNYQNIKNSKKLNIKNVIIDYNDSFGSYKNLELLLNNKHNE